MLSRSEVLDQIAEGKLLALDGPVNGGKYLFSSTSLDGLRNSVVSFVANSICRELARKGADEETMAFAVRRAFERQHDLARRGEVINFDQDDDSHPVRNAALLAGAAGAGYLGYRAWKNRRPGQPRLPGYGGSGPTIDLPPSGPPPFDPNNANGVTAGVERHPAPRSGDMLMTASPAPNIARQTAGQTVNGDLLGNAVKRGKSAIAQKGSALLRALRSIPLE
jgi:hypothetical protein